MAPRHVAFVVSGARPAPPPRRPGRGGAGAGRFGCPARIRPGQTDAGCRVAMTSFPYVEKVSITALKR